YITEIYRPNIYIVLYYPNFVEEYTLIINFNILIRENLYKYFKTRIYEINYFNIEKVLLIKSNFREIV
ncbi:hypothetical protein QBC45DRAFT_325180, partial [Copromyces sp. CBS 386.78]